MLEYELVNACVLTYKHQGSRFSNSPGTLQCWSFTPQPPMPHGERSVKLKRHIVHHVWPAYGRHAPSCNANVTETSTCFCMQCYGNRTLVLLIFNTQSLITACRDAQALHMAMATRHRLVFCFMTWIKFIDQVIAECRCDVMCQLHILSGSCIRLCVKNVNKWHHHGLIRLLTCRLRLWKAIMVVKR